jgi:hypothetical protein
MIKSRMERTGNGAVTREIDLLRIYRNFGVRKNINNNILQKLLLVILEVFRLHIYCNVLGVYNATNNFTPYSI